MSKVIDERVVEMRFDNRHFEQNVSQTMSTLEKLKQKLNFKGASKGLEDIGEATKKVDMHGLGTGIETVRAKFSALQIAGVTALVDITKTAVNAGKRIANALTLEPIMSGFREYETQMNAVQTILANTQSKGSTLEDVNAALDELNLYADKTIYNFTEMTRNIGTFTAAGIDLKTSVCAIQGIANLAAVSGSTSQQASVAMYQLSQALAAGTVKLTDWNSVVNAGMGGEIFQNALKKTSEELKTGAEAAIKAKGSFRESLQTGWLTAEVLTETLKKFTTSGANEYVAEYIGLTVEAVNATLDSAKAQYGEADAVSEAAKMLAQKSGKNEEEIKTALQMARTAEDAATKVKTFTQLWDVMKEAAQSGWSQTWRLIIGDFEEAKNLFTPIADFFTGDDGLITKMSNARNALLEGALGKTISGISDSVNKFLTPAKKASKAVNKITDSISDLGDIVDKVILGDFGNGVERIKKLTDAGYNYAQVQNKVNEKLGVSFRRVEDQIRAEVNLAETKENVAEATSEEAEAVIKLSDEQKSLLKDLAVMSEVQARAKGYTDEQIEAFRELEDTAKKLGIPINEFIDNLDQINGRWLLINSFKNIGKSVIEIFTAMGEAWRESFKAITPDQLFDVIAAFHRFTSSIRTFVSGNAEELRNTFSGIFAALDIVLTLVAGPLKIAFKVLEQVLDAFDLNILDVTSSIGKAIVRFRDWLDSVLDFSGIIEKIVPHVKNFTKKIKELCASFKNNSAIQSFIGTIKKLGELFKKLFTLDIRSSEFKDVAQQIREIFASIPGKMTEIGKNIVQGLQNGIGAKASEVFSKIKEVAQRIIAVVCEILGIQSPSTVFFEIGKNIILGLTNGISRSLGPKVFESIKNFFKNFIESVKEADFVNAPKEKMSAFLDAVKSFGKNIVESVKEIEFIGVLKEKLSGFIDVLKEKTSTIWEFIKEFSKKIDFGKLFAAGVTIGIFATIKNITDLLNKFTDVLDKFAAPFEGLGEMLEGIGKGVQSWGQSKKITAISDLILNVAKAIAILAASIFVLTSIDSTKMWEAIKAIGALIGLMAGLSLAIALISKLGSSFKISASIISISAGLLILAITLNKLSQIDSTKLPIIMETLEAAVTSLISILLAIGLLSKFGANLSGAGSTILKASIALLLMVRVIKLAGNLNGSEVKKGLKVVALVGLLFSALIMVSSLSGEHASKAGNMLIKMSFAMLLMVGVVKVAAGLNGSEVRKGLKVVGQIGLLFAAIIAVSKLAGENASKAGTMLILMSGALLIMVGVIKLIAAMNEDDIKKGLKTVAVLELLFMGVIAVSKLAGEHANKAGSMLLSMSVALLILTGVMYLLSKFDEDDLKRSLGAIVILEACFAGLIAVTKLAKDTKGFKGSLIVMVLAISLLAMAVAGLSFIPAEDLKAATIALSSIMGMFAIMIASTKFANVDKGLAKNLIVMLGVVIVLSAVITALSYIPNPDTAIKMTGTLVVLLLAFTAVTAVLGAMEKTLNPKSAAKGAASLAIVIGIITAVVGVIGLLIGLIPEDFMNKITTGLDRFVSMMQQVAILILAFIPVTAALAAIGKYLGGVGAAASGAAGLVAVIGIIGAAAVAIGSLMQLFTDDFFSKIETGLDRFIVVMEKIGAAMGGLIGGFIGGVAEGVMSTLPAMGQHLSDFMTNVQPFIDGCKNIDGSVLAGIGFLSGAIIALTAADVIASITTLLPKVSSFGELGDSLSDFIINAEPFISGASRLDENLVSGFKTLAEAILILTASDVIDGLTSWFTGGSSLENFGAQLPQLGTDLKDFVTNLGTFDDAAVTAVDCAGKIISSLADAAKLIPNEGGLWAKLFGDNSIATFGSYLPAFARDLRSFITNLGTFDDGKLTTVQIVGDAIVALSDAAKLIPNEGGLWAKLFGDNSIATFGSYLPDLGTNLSSFITNLGTFSDAQLATVQIAANAIVALSDAADLIPNEGGLWAKLFGDNSIAKFGSYLPDLGTNLSSFITNLGTFNDAQLSTVQIAGNAIVALSDAAKLIPNEGGLWAKLVGDNSLATFGSHLPDLGTNLSSFITNLGTFDDAQLSTVYCAGRAVVSLATAAKELPNEGNLWDRIFGKNILDTILTGITADSLYTISLSLGILADSVEKWVDLKVPEDLGTHLGTLAKGILKFSADGVGASALSTAAPAVGILADSIKKWEGVTVPDDIGTKMGQLASGVLKFSTSGIGAGVLNSSAPGIGALADSVRKWDGVIVPDGIETDLTSIANGIEAFSFAFAGGWSISALIDPLANLPDSISKWKDVTIPDSLESGLTSLATGISKFTFMSSIAFNLITGPLADLATSIKAWDGIEIPFILGNRIGSLATGVSKFTFMSSISFNLITGPLADLAGTMKEWETVSIPDDIETQLTSLSNGIGSFLSAFLGGVSLAVIVGPFDDLATSLRKFNSVSIPDGIESDLTALSNGIKSFDSAFLSTVSLFTVSRSLRDFATSVRKWEGVTVSSTVESGLKALSSGVKSFSDVDSKSVSSATNSIDSLYSSIEKLVDIDFSYVSDGLQKVCKSLKDFSSEEFSKIGSNAIDSLMKSLKRGQKSLSTQTIEIITVMVKVIDSKKSAFIASGAKIMTSLLEGISKKKSNLIGVFRTSLSSAVGSIAVYGASFYSAGSQLAIGFANGISGSSFRAKMAAVAMAKTALDAAKEALGIASPSVEGYELGTFYGLGFVLALKDYGAKVYKASESMAVYAKDGLKEAIDKIQSTINSDMDFQPTIRPVLDLSDVKTGANSIDSLFGRTGTIGLHPSVNSISSLMNQRIQNGKNSDIISEISKLRRDINNMERDSYTVNGVTYDDGSNVSEAVKALIRATRVERRV